MRRSLRWTALWAVAVGLGLAIPAARAADREYPAPKAPAELGDYGRQIQRTMTLLATSTAEKPNRVRILFYGQSITQQKWWKLVEADLRTRFPHADLECRNLALGGFASQLLVRTSEYDLYPWYPDLLVFHVYGDHRRYEDIIRRTRERTTAEIIIQTDHVTKTAEDDWTKMMNYTFLPRYAHTYGCQLGQVRPSWKEYLADNKLQPAQLLSDGVHLNAWGEFVMGALVNQELVYRSDIKEQPWKDLVRTYVVGKDIDWKDDKLSLTFQGNRVTALVGPAAGGESAKVLLDGNAPSTRPKLYYHARPSGTPNIGWPAIKRIAFDKPLQLEDWTLTVHDVNADANQFTFDVVGSKTGPDGSGKATEKFVSKSGRVVIEPEDWVFEFDRKVSKKPTTDGFVVRWKVLPLFTDVCQPPATVADPRKEHEIVLAQGFANASHKLELVGKTAILAIRVYCPPRPATD